MWQDTVLSAASMPFVLTGLSMVREHHKHKVVSVPHSMSIPTGFFVMITAFIYFTLGLTLSTVVTTFIGLIWFIAALQRKIYGEALKFYIGPNMKEQLEAQFFEPGDSNIKIFGPFNLNPRDTTGSVEASSCKPSSSLTRCKECRNTQCDKHPEFNSGGMYG